MTHTCKTCGAVADEPGHLCDPCGDETQCDFCGAQNVDARHVCKERLERMRYVCQGCGRVAMEEWNVCDPAPIS